MDEATLAVVREGLPSELPLFAPAVERHEAVFVDGREVLENEPITGEAIWRYGAACALPVVVGGELRGLLVAGLGAAGPWPEPSKAVTRAVARGLALALERADVTERLAAQKAKLEERNAEAETFVYTVSHDLRAPLLAIRGMAELLEEAVVRDDADEGAFLLGRVARNVDKMGDLLNDLLALSRVGRWSSRRRSSAPGTVLALRGLPAPGQPDRQRGQVRRPAQRRAEGCGHL